MPHKKQFPRQPLSRKQMRDKRQKFQMRGMEILDALHEASAYTSFLLESTQIGDEDYYLRIYVGRDEVSAETLGKIIAVADVYNAPVSLREGKITVWVPHA